MSPRRRDWALRRAVAADAGALSVCFEVAYGAYAGLIDDLPPVSKNLAAEIETHEVWVAESGGEIAGGLVLMAGEGFLHLVNVAVHPDHRGAGLGRALMDLAESRALDQGLREMRLSTHVDMPANVAMYAHLGWREVGRQGNKVAMTKVL